MKKLVLQLVIPLLFALAQPQLYATQLQSCQTDECKKYFNKFKVSSKKGHPVALATLGQFYYSGYGTEQNESLAIEYFVKAARKGNIAAKYKVGMIYLISEENKDLEKGMKYLQKASISDYKNATFYLGITYLSKKFGQYDLALADEYLAKSYRNKHPLMPDVIDHITDSIEIDQLSFPQLYSAMNKNPLITNNKISAWPNDGTEIISINAPAMESIFDDLLISFRKPIKSTGTRIKGKSCEDIIGCVGSKGKGFAGLALFPFARIAGGK